MPVRDVMSDRVKQRVGRGFITIVAGLLAFNVFVLIRNQLDHRFTEPDRFAIRPRSIALSARQNTMQTVKTTFAAYHTMRNRLGGTHLLLPARLEAHKFALERVSRLEVELGPTLIVLPSAVVQRLFDVATDVWSMEPENLTGAIIEPGATRYVLVLRPEDFGLMVIITEERYQRERAEADRQAGGRTGP